MLIRRKPQKVCIFVSKNSLSTLIKEIADKNGEKNSCASLINFQSFRRHFKNSSILNYALSSITIMESW